MTNLTERLDKHLQNVKESWYKDLYDKEPSFVPVEEIYKELITSPKYRKFKISTNNFELTDKDASWYSMGGFGHSRAPEQKIIEWSTPKFTKSLPYGDYKVYLGFNDVAAPIENLKYVLRLEIPLDKNHHKFGTNSFHIHPKSRDSIKSIADEVFGLVLKYTEMAIIGE